jgi:thiosulfate/3-mercaptopyruvate sulfurtransferase
MSADQPLPLLLEPALLEAITGAVGLVVLDLRSQEAYATGHIPGAISADYGDFIEAKPPAMGLLPDLGHLSQVLGTLGITPEHHVVTYDDEGGGRAGRVIWTLHALGHERCSLLNGGFHAWDGEDHPVEGGQVAHHGNRYEARLDNPGVLATKEYIQSHLGSEDLALLDTRSHAEFEGTDVRAARGGHIPGAINLNWTDAMDRTRRLRLLPDETLWALLESLTVVPDKEVVVYCHTHHRSAHTYVMLKHLGFPRVRGYAGAWSEWGNDPNMPIER